ncbi:MAG: leucine-rich repeat protein [Christensenellaceae bacterium]
MGEYMFLDDVLLTEIVLPDTVETIGLNAVSNTAIASFIVPAAATSIHNKAFAECFSLTEIIVPGENAAYSSRDGILYDKAQATLI